MASKKIVLHFPHRLVDQPIVYRLVKDYDLTFNILKASIMPNEEGLLVLDLIGSDENCKKGLEYLKSSGVKIQLLSKDLLKDDTRCINCSVCVPLCPEGALVVDPSTRNVSLNIDKCIACELCIKACPMKAIKIAF